MDVHPTKNVSIGIDPYPYWNLVPNYCNSVSIETFTIFPAILSGRHANVRVKLDQLSQKNIVQAVYV
jgi:hypothetical protein